MRIAVQRTGLVLVALLFVAGGGLSTWFLALQPLADAWRSRNWQPVTARVEAVDRGPSPGAGLRGWQLQVIYRYQVQGRRYESRRYGLHTWVDDHDAQQAAYVDLIYRRRVQAWYNPAAPGESLLNRDIHWNIVALGLPALGAVLLGALLLWAAAVAGWSAWQTASLRKAGRVKKPGV
ncbi:MAG: DUF3592 domain-containing protein [Azovibrio sp.]|uniref:DUF3592 domain-containing protein n=1 Tax=Azovibrio sp. TaxID=1872673 RepID=UPI003C78BAFE